MPLNLPTLAEPNLFVVAFSPETGNLSSFAVLLTRRRASAPEPQAVNRE